MSQQNYPERADHLDVRGSATLFTLSDKAGIGAVTGTLEGAAYGEPTSEPAEHGDGRFTYTMFHHFFAKDGSRLFTHDQAIMRPATRTEEKTALEVDYTIVEATGRFAGFSGTFHGKGWLKPEGEGAVAGNHTTGVIRFDGTIHRDVANAQHTNRIAHAAS
ncbi:hypothetical protein SAMN05421837_11824 [Amycolatopsis pretoriensis]|uniref:Uncharacterized protein n=1 Tax=Amycolatopsis pretoriensis TaxID=218821 RepID=A0A1H5RI87_9PSEU|nr:hypothetical protein [Amycolatopsis pretoriensis]SEF38073.1 hypothetical protein SAMN05421837_11824 [Amycolatopsis pretoriensis]